MFFTDDSIFLCPDSDNLDFCTHKLWDNYMIPCAAPTCNTNTFQQML